jgi:hypothetical protein
LATAQVVLATEQKTLSIAQVALATTKADNAANSATAAASSQSSATASASTATTKASEAAASAVSAAASLDLFTDQYLGSKSSAPSVDNDGDALTTGDLYYDSTAGSMKYWSGSAWVSAYISAAGMAALSGATFTGNVTVPNLVLAGSGTVDGRDVSADGTKLDGIAASANNYTHPNHSGEVTSTADGATIVADNIIDEANLKVSNSPTNGYVLTAQSGNTGGLTWAADTNTTYNVGDGGLTQNNFTNTLKTKLDGIEASSNVTDTANVTAAGALMDSEVTNLAQVKAFAASDYATAAQGTLAAAALPKAGGAMTGAITTNSTFDGVDIATRDAVLTSTTTTANAALPKAGGTMTGSVKGSTDTDTSNTGSVTLNFTTNQNFVLTLTGNVTLANPSTEVVGQSGFITLIQDGTGGRTLSLGSDYETAAGAGITLTSTASATDIVPYVVAAAGRILLGAPQLAFS